MFINQAMFSNQAAMTFILFVVIFSLIICALMIMGKIRFKVVREIFYDSHNDDSDDAADYSETSVAGGAGSDSLLCMPSSTAGGGGSVDPSVVVITRVHGITIPEHITSYAILNDGVWEYYSRSHGLFVYLDTIVQHDDGTFWVLELKEAVDVPVATPGGGSQSR
jgi:hypothetical protein